MAQRPSLTTSLSYKDPRAAIAWLEKAFGFELTLLVEDDKGDVGHSDLSFGSGAVMVGGEWSADHKSPASIGGKNTQSVHMQIDTDLGAHCERARAAGAEIIVEPALQFYGDITYRCRDPEGHIWTVAQTVAAVTIEEMAAATGLKITGRV